MRNIGNISIKKTNLPLDKVRRSSFEKAGCCEFIRHLENPKNSVYVKIPRGWCSLTAEQIKEYRKICLYAGFKWHIRNEYTGRNNLYIEIKYDEQVSGAHALATFSTIRYMYSPYYTGLVIAALKAKEHGVSCFNALLLGHYGAKKYYGGYFGMIESISYIHKTTKKNVLQKLKSRGINASFKLNSLKSIPKDTRNEAKKGNFKPLIKML